ncbi:hypothetical protein ACLKA6_018171 [Drosophila palustris]
MSRKCRENVEKIPRNAEKMEKYQKIPRKCRENTEKMQRKCRENTEKYRENSRKYRENTEKCQKIPRKIRENTEKYKKMSRKCRENTEKYRENVEKMPRNTEKMSRKYREMPRKYRKNIEKMPENVEKMPRNAEKMTRKYRENTEKNRENTEKCRENAEKMSRKYREIPRNTEKIPRKCRENAEKCRENTEKISRKYRENAEKMSRKSEKCRENAEKIPINTEKMSRKYRENTEKNRENTEKCREYAEKMPRKCRENAEKIPRNTEKIPRKCMGYVSVFLSIASLLFYAIFAIVPLIFILHSLRPTMPWSCEGMGDVGNLTTFGKLLRYMILSALVILLVCLTRFIFLPGALDGLVHYVKPHLDSTIAGSFSMTVVVLQAFGSGWGTVMSLSSFNGFKTNIMSYSWIIAFGQTLVYILFGMVSFIIQHYFRAMSVNSFDLYVETNWVLYLSSASALATLEWANLWTILYYSMLLIASLIVMITQIFTVLTSLFDEFEILREHKQRVTYGFIAFLGLCSLLLCTNHGIMFFSTASVDSIFTYSVMHLLLILAVLWIYGRERFQRDIEFMLGQPFASWKIFLLRFIAPLFLLSSLLFGLYASSMEHLFASTFVEFISVILVLLPLFFIPGYGLYITYRNSGGFCNRFRRACRPTDWYPQEMEDRQKYEEAVGNSDLTHQLYEVTEEVN